MNKICRMYDRNYVVEKYLYLIDRVIRSNWALMKAAHMDYDDVFQQLAIRLMRCVETFDPKKGELEQHIYAQLKYELLNCKSPYRMTGITGAPKDFCCGNVISIDALPEGCELYNQLMAA